MTITKKDAEIQANNIVKTVLEDNSNLSSILRYITVKDDSIRYPNAIALEILSEKYPKIIYPEWSFFFDLLKSTNAYHRSVAITTISNLTAVDNQNKFEEIFGQFFKLIDDKSVIVTRKLALYVGRIARAKPTLSPRITEILLSIDDTQHNSSRKDLIKGDIIESFSEYFNQITEKEKIFNFVRNQLNSSSPSTIEKAKSFLSKWEK